MFSLHYNTREIKTEQRWEIAVLSIFMSRNTYQRLLVTPRHVRQYTVTFIAFIVSFIDLYSFICKRKPSKSKGGGIAKLLTHETSALMYLSQIQVQSVSLGR